MGIFDAANYSPVGNGTWLDGILRSVGVQPSAGFPQSPAMNANAATPPAAAPAPQNAPIAVGDYQMPRIGGGFLGEYPQHDPQTGATVQPAAAPASAPGPIQNFFDKTTAGLHSIASGGSLGAAISGNFDDPKTQQAQIAAQTARALINKGVDSNVAMAAVQPGNAEMLKTLVTQTFGPNTVQSLGEGYVYNPKTGKTKRAYTPEQKDNFTVVQRGEDGMGGKTFVKMNKTTGEETPWTTPSASGAAVSGLGDMTKVGAEFLATLPPELAGRVKAMAEGRQPPPSGLAQTKPYWQNLIAATQAYDPTFDATNWSGRVAGVKDFSAGKSSEMVRSANQTLHHVNSLLDSADALHNGNYPSVNWVGNKLNEATGGGEPTAFVINAHAVADEMGKVFKGANLSDAEIHAWADNLSPNMSPAQQRAAVGKMTELLHGALDALDEKRVASMGQMAADKAGPIIKPEGQAVLKRIEGWLKANGGNSAGALPAGWTVKVN